MRGLREFISHSSTLFELTFFLWHNVSKYLLANSHKWIENQKNLLQTLSKLFKCSRPFERSKSFFVRCKATARLIWTHLNKSKFRRHVKRRLVFKKILKKWESYCCFRNRSMSFLHLTKNDLNLSEDLVHQ